jgi:hypothetical protein
VLLLGCAANAAAVAAALTTQSVSLLHSGALFCLIPLDTTQPAYMGGGGDCAREGVSVANFGLGWRSFDLWVLIWDLEMPYRFVVADLLITLDISRSFCMQFSVGFLFHLFLCFCGVFLRVRDIFLFFCVKVFTHIRT